MMLPAIASWCLLIVVIIIIVCLVREFINAPLVDEDGQPVVLVDDHPFDGGWHQRDTCQFIYEGTDFTEDWVCGEPAEVHADDEDLL